MEERPGPFLLIESRSTWESGEIDSFLRTALDLASAGRQVDLFLIQNGVLMARPGAAPFITALQQQPGITIWVDEFSLAARLPEPRLLEGLVLAGADKLVELMVRPACKTVWH